MKSNDITKPHNSHLLNFDSLLIITYGRSGSTLLQGILNDIPGVLIKGENKNFIFPLFEAFERMRMAKIMGGKTPQHPWFGAKDFDPIKFARDLSEPIKQQLISTHTDILCYGFKEVRYAWTTENLPDSDQLQDFGFFEQYLNFLSLIFPNVCFVFNSRDISAVTESAWWLKRDQSWVKSHIESVQQLFNQYVEKYPKKSFLIDYSDVINQSKKLEHLFYFLGADYDENRVSKTLALKHSYQPKTNRDLTKKISIDKVNSSEINDRIQKLSIDSLAKELKQGQSINITGIIITKIGMPKISAISLKNAHDSFEGVIGLESPIMQKRFPNNPSATNARFMFKNIKPKTNQTLELFAQFTDGKKIFIVELKM